MSLLLDILMFLFFHRLIQIHSYPILAPGGRLRAETFLGTLACPEPQVCRVYLKDTSPHLRPNSFLSVLEMVGRCLWE